jgi:hypothetical protein
MLLDAEVQLLIQVETLEAAIARAIAIVETVKAKDTE